LAEDLGGQSWDQLVSGLRADLEAERAQEQQRQQQRQEEDKKCQEFDQQTKHRIKELEAAGEGQGAEAVGLRRALELAQQERKRPQVGQASSADVLQLRSQSLEASLGERILALTTSRHAWPKVFAREYWQLVARRHFVAIHQSQMPVQQQLEETRTKEQLAHRKSLEQRLKNLESVGEGEGAEAQKLRKLLSGGSDEATRETTLELPGLLLSVTGKTLSPGELRAEHMQRKCLAMLHEAMQTLTDTSVANEAEQAERKHYYQCLKSVASLLGDRKLADAEKVWRELYAWLLGIPSLEVLVDKTMCEHYDKEQSRAKPLPTEKKSTEQGWKQGWSGK